jgi:hypothetical protein
MARRRRSTFDDAGRSKWLRRQAAEPSERRDARPGRHGSAGGARAAARTRKGDQSAGVQQRREAAGRVRAAQDRATSPAMQVNRTQNECAGQRYRTILRPQRGGGQGFVGAAPPGAAPVSRTRAESVHSFHDALDRQEQGYPRKRRGGRQGW